MNLIEESFQNKEEKKRKKTAKVVLVAIFLVVMIIIGIIAYLLYIQSTILKVTIDGQLNEGIKNLLVIEEDGTVYLPIKEVASYFGYESYNGEYSEKSEEQHKCYVQCEDEVANFTLGSNKIYKLDISKSNNDNNYEYVYTKKPVKAIQGVLYATSEGIEQAFNISFQYDQAANRIAILTMPYLIQYYSTAILDYGYAELSDVFANEKTSLQSMLVVKKDKEKNKLGVIDMQGNIILEPKYDNITYLPNTGDFLVETNGKVGILSKNKETKVQIMYDSIELMDSDAGLYLVKKDNKYGVIDIKGNIKIYIENDEIGIDASKYTNNNIKSKYIIADNFIPVRKDKLWGLYDKSGKQVVDFHYDEFGYISTSNKDALNLLVIPEYNVLVAQKDKKYTLLNTSGQEIFPTVADDIFMTISGGEKHYYIAVNDERMDALEYLNRNGITAKESSSSNQNKSNNTTTDNNQTTNTNKQNTTSESVNSDSSEQNQQDENNQQDQSNQEN